MPDWWTATHLSTSCCATVGWLPSDLGSMPTPRAGVARRSMAHARPLGRARPPDPVGVRPPPARRLRRHVRSARRHARRRGAPTAPGHGARRLRVPRRSVARRADGRAARRRRRGRARRPGLRRPALRLGLDGRAPLPRRRRAPHRPAPRVRVAPAAGRPSTTCPTTSPTRSSTTPPPPPRHAGSSASSTWRSPTTCAVWRRRIAARPARLRVRAGVWEEFLDRVVREDLHTGDAIGGLVTQGPLKVITDGSLNTRTAYCHDPYPGLAGPNARGILAVPAVAARTPHGARHPPRPALRDPRDRRRRERAGPRRLRRVRRDRVDRARPAGVLGGRRAVRGARGGRQRAARARHGRPRRRRPLLGRSHRPRVRLRVAPPRRASGWRSGPTHPSRPSTRGSPSTPRSAGPATGVPPGTPSRRIDRRVALESSVDGRGLTVAVGAPADLVVLDADPLTAPLRGMPVAGTLVAGGLDAFTAPDLAAASCGRTRRGG